MTTNPVMTVDDVHPRLRSSIDVHATLRNDLLTTGFAEHIIVSCLDQGILRNQCAYILATSEWETAHTQKPVKEAFWLSESWRESNLRYYPWYGRGLVQLTWEENYRRQQEKHGWGTQLTDNPDEALNPDKAKLILIGGMMDGDFTPHKLTDFVTIDKSDFVGARQVVNGKNKAAEIASIALEYDKELLKVGYGVDQPPTDITATVEALVRLSAQHEEKLADLEKRLAAMEQWRVS